MQEKLTQLEKRILLWGKIPEKLIQLEMIMFLLVIMQEGRNITGNHNIFIGNFAGISYTSGSSYNLDIGGLITGNMASDSQSVNILGTLNCMGSTCGNSSKIYKKHIKSYVDYEKSLQDILKTPLFKYKRIDEHSEKFRIGIIAENLPVHLQLQEKPLKPDWPSIYGTLWGGIKALTNRFIKMKQEFFLEIENIKGQLVGTNRMLLKTQRKLTETETRLEEAFKKLTQMEKQLKKTKLDMGKQLESHDKKLKILKNTIKETPN